MSSSEGFGIPWPCDEITPGMLMLKPGLVLRERCPGYVQEWYCEPPVLGTRFRVRPGGDEWIEEDGVPVRRIREIEGIADDVTGQHG